MLTRVIAIKNVGRFINSVAQPNPAFGRHTFLFAANSYGKSTLCAILRSLSSGDTTLVSGRKRLGAASDPEIDVRFTDGNHRFSRGAWSALEPRISIFDSAFVADNVHSGDIIDVAHKRGLFRVIVGQAGVGLAKQEQSLAEAARAKQGELTAAERLVDAHRPRAMAFAAFLALEGDPEVDQKIREQDALVAALRQAEAIRARPLLIKIEPRTLPDHLAQLLARSIDDVAENAETLVREHTERHQMQRDGQRWISEGLAFEGDEECPFCGRPGLNGLELIDAYKAVFSEAYATLRRDIQTAIQEVRRNFDNAAQAQIRTIVAQNAGAVDFWAQHCELDRDSLAIPENVFVHLEAANGAATTAIERKLSAPLERIVDDPDIANASEAVRVAATAIDAYNRGVDRANGLIQAKKDGTAAADPVAANARLEILRATQLRHRPDVAGACTNYQACRADKTRLENEKVAVRQQLEAHCRTVVRPYEDRINYFLDRFNADFRLMRTDHGYPGGIATSTYQIAINNIPFDVGDANTTSQVPSFKNTLSAGDRSTLALAFFLANVEREPDLADRIVIFDDPFNSQDSFRRHHTQYEVMRIADLCGQTIVLSHDPQFLKRLWEKSNAQNRTALQIAYHRSTGSKMCQFDLDGACRGRSQAELGDLIAYRATGAGQPREIIKKLRIVIETHMRTTYPGSFNAQDNYGAILAKIRNGGDQHPAHEVYDELDRINDYSAQYHHGEEPVQAGEPAIDEAELVGFVQDTLRLVNALPT